MTERYVGWTPIELRYTQNGGAKGSEDATSRGHAMINPSFTPINQNVSRSHASPSRRHSENRDASNVQEKRHPRVLARYLGLGSDASEHSGLDQLTTVNVSPPFSPSEKNIPKRKRAGERIAKELEQAEKKAKTLLWEYASSSEQILEPSRRVGSAHAEMTAPGPSSTGSHHLFSDNASYPESPQVRSIPLVPLSQNTLQGFDAWKYTSQSTQPEPVVEHSQQNVGIISLVAPVTSMDLFQASQTPVSRLCSVSTSFQHTVTRLSPTFQCHSNTVRSRRAPSTGQALEPILEELSSPEILSLSGAQTITARGPTISYDLKHKQQPPFCQSAAQQRRFVFALVPLQVTKPEAPITPPVNDEDFDALDAIDDEDLFSMESALKESCNGHNHNGTDGHAPELLGLPIPQLIGLPTPQNSDETPSDIIDIDNWLQLSDLETEAMIPTKTEEAEVKPQQPDPLSPQAPGSLAAAMLPVARPTFPSAILDRSPLLNITSSLALKTCFRIGEALNVGAHYARQSSSFVNDGILIELYARVISSCRPSCHSSSCQNFILGDLWSEKGPKLQGEWTGWKGSKLFESDAKNLLTGEDNDGDNKTCRVVGRMKRENKEWRLTVLSAWECGWEDVEIVKGVVFRL